MVRFLTPETRPASKTPKAAESLRNSEESKQQGCRFVPYTFLETNKATDGTKKDLNIGVSPGALAA